MIHIKAQAQVFSVCFRKSNEGVTRVYAKRCKISGFSAGSRRNMCRYLRSSVAEYKSFGTLTYPASDTVKYDFKRDFKVFCDRVRREFCSVDGNIFSMFWFVEFTKLGTPHLHFYCNQFIPHEWLSRNWASVCSLDNQEHETAGTSIQSLPKGRDFFVKYASKYAWKQEQKDLPPLYENEKIGRWWGVVGLRQVVAAATRVEPWEYVGFAVVDLVESVRKCGAKLIFDDFGAEVYYFQDRSQFEQFLLRLNDVNKVLLQAEQIEASRLYRKRRG